MRIATKLAVAISAAFILILVAASVLLVVADLRFTNYEMNLHGKLLGQVVASSVEENWREGGDPEVLQLIHEIDRHERNISVRWINPQAPPGGVEYSAALDPGTRRALARGELVQRESPQHDDRFYTFVPLPGAGNDRVIEIAESLQPRNQYVHADLLRMLAVAGLGALMSTLCAFILGRRLVGRPVRELVAQARRIGAGDLTASAPETAGNELGELAREMNEMARNLAASREWAATEEKARREAEAGLQHADKLATVGRLAAGVAHEIATPLQSIAMRAELIGSKAGHIESVSGWAEGIKRQSERIAAITRGLLEFSRRDHSTRVPRDLREIVGSATSLVGSSRNSGSIEIVERLPDEPAVTEVAAEQLTQVLTNLIVNAMQAMPDGGRITVGLDARRATPPPDREQVEGDYWCLFVQDEGCGIPEDALPHLFEPFFTTKPAGEGTGLGLAIVYGIARQHGGWIDVESRVGEGSRFSVYLPRSPQS